jgi:hypothetical protein
MAATNHVIVGVAWDESVIARMLPAGIRPVAGAPGAINIFTVDRGFGIARYQAVYYLVGRGGLRFARRYQGSLDAGGRLRSE